MNKCKIIILAIAIVLLIVSFLYLQTDLFAFSFSPRRVITIIDFKGDVKVITSGGSKTINGFKNMRLKQGDQLLSGLKSWVKLKIDTDNQFMVSENTILSIDGLSGSNNKAITILLLETGKLWTNIKEKLSDSSKYEIKTPTAVMGVRGTKFYVEATNDIAMLAVLDGIVSISTVIMTQDHEGNSISEEVTFLINRNKQITIEKDQEISKEELVNKIKDVVISSIDVDILKYIQQDFEGIDQDILNRINEYIKHQTLEATLFQKNQVQVTGVVFLPDGRRNTDGGHIHIRNSDNEWVYYGLLNANGGFVAGNLPDGQYWLRSDPDQVNEYARSNEIPFNIMNAKANPDIINLHLNNIQLSATIANPESLPVTEGYLYVSDSKENWIYYAEIENAINIIQIGGLPDGSYTIIAYPALNSEFVQSDVQNIRIINGKTDSSNVTLILNTPQFSGTVLLTDGKSAAAGSHIHVRDKTNTWLQYINTDTNGGFKIGGLKNGKYWLWSDSLDDLVSSNEFELEIINGKATPALVQLILNE